MIKRVVFGPVANDKVKALQDINGRETLVLTALAAGVLAIGVFPLPLLEVVHVSVDNLLQHAVQSKL